MTGFSAPTRWHTETVYAITDLHHPHQARPAELAS